MSDFEITMSIQNIAGDLIGTITTTSKEDFESLTRSLKKIDKVTETEDGKTVIWFETAA